MPQPRVDLGERECRRARAEQSHEERDRERIDPIDVVEGIRKTDGWREHVEDGKRAQKEKEHGWPEAERGRGDQRDPEEDRYRETDVVGAPQDIDRRMDLRAMGHPEKARAGPRRERGHPRWSADEKREAPETRQRDRARQRAQRDHAGEHETHEWMRRDGGREEDCRRDEPRPRSAHPPTLVRVPRPGSEAAGHDACVQAVVHDPGPDRHRARDADRGAERGET